MSPSVSCMRPSHEPIYILYYLYFITILFVHKISNAFSLGVVHILRNQLRGGGGGFQMITLV